MARATTQVPANGFSSNSRKSTIVDSSGNAVYSNNPDYAVKYRGNFSAAQTDLEVIASPGAGWALFLTDVVFTNGATAGNMYLREVKGASSAYIIPPTYLDKVGGGATSSVPIHFVTPLKLNSDFALEFSSTTVTTHSLVVSGYFGPAPDLTTTSTTSSTSTSTSTTSTSTSTTSTSTSTSSTTTSTSTSSTSTSTSTTSTSTSTSSTLSTTSSTSSTLSTSSTSSTLSTTSSTSSTLSTTSSTSSTLSSTSTSTSTSTTVTSPP